MLWQNSYDSKKKEQHKANKPKPFIPDFMKDKNADTALKEAEVKTTDDIRDILAKPRQ